MSKLKYKNIAIKREKIKPNVAANFLGGANMGFGFNLNNLETLFAIYASGEVIFVNDLSAKSRVRNIAMNIQLNANEIGRASCREREKIAEVAGAMEIESK